jgi:hypothetical protein
LFANSCRQIHIITAVCQCQWHYSMNSLAGLPAALHFVLGSSGRLSELERSAATEPGKVGHKARVFLAIIRADEADALSSSDFGLEPLRAQLHDWHALRAELDASLSGSGSPDLGELSERIYQNLVARAGLLLDLHCVDSAGKQYELDAVPRRSGSDAAARLGAQISRSAGATHMQHVESQARAAQWEADYAHRLATDAEFRRSEEDKAERREHDTFDHDREAARP